MLDKKMDELSPQDVLTAVSELKAYYSQRTRGVKKGLELYQRRAKLKVPDGIIEVLTHSATTICDRGADRVGSARLQAHMEARRTGAKEEKHIEALEKAVAAIFYMARKRAKFNPIRAWALHAFNRGAMVAKVQIDDRAMTDAPERKDFDSDLAFQKATKLWKYQSLARFPLIIDARPIESLYPDPETDGDDFMIEHYKRKWGDIKKNYPRAVEVFGDALTATKRFRDDESVEFTEVTTTEYRCVVIEGQWCPIGDFPAGPVPNLFARPPYFVRYPFGDPSGPPEERCVNILRAIEDELLMESRMMTVVQAVAETSAYGATVVSSKDEAAKSTIAFGPGAVVETDMPAGERPSPLVQQNRLADALQALSVAQRSTSEGAVPSEARGEASPNRTGTPTGVAAAILTGQASMVIAPVVDSIQDMISDLASFLLYAIDNVYEKPIPLYGQIGKSEFVDLTLDSELIDGHYGPVYVELHLNKISNEQAAFNLGIQAMQTGRFPDEWVLETFFGEENASAMLEDAHAMRIANSQEVDAYLKARLIEALSAKLNGTADKLPGQNVPAPTGATMPPPPGMLPPGPGGPPPMVPASGMAGPPQGPDVRAAMGQTQPAAGAAGMVAPPVMS